MSLARKTGVASRGIIGAIAQRTWARAPPPTYLSDVATGRRQLVGPMVGQGAIGMACSGLRRRGGVSPNLEVSGPCGSILNGGHLVAAKPEQSVDPVMGGQDARGLAGRL